MQAHCAAKPGAWADNPWDHPHPVFKVGPGERGKIFAFLGGSGVGVKAARSREDRLGRSRIGELGGDDTGGAARTLDRGPHLIRLVARGVAVDQDMPPILAERARQRRTNAPGAAGDDGGAGRAEFGRHARASSGCQRFRRLLNPVR